LSFNGGGVKTSSDTDLRSGGSGGSGGDLVKTIPGGGSGGLDEDAADENDEVIS
jgi:hypothetical protein